MNHRDTALAAMRGQPVDHIPFIARMDLWYTYHRNCGTLPDRYQKSTLMELQRDLGIGIFGRGVGYPVFYRLDHRGVDTDRNVDGQRMWTHYHTPYGDLTTCDMQESALHGAVDWARIEYPFKSSRDFDALEFLIEHTEVVDNLSEYGRFVEAIGSDGLALPHTGALPAHKLMIDYMGYEGFYLSWHDHPSRVQRLIDALTQQYQEILKVALQCPVQAIEVGGNYDEQMTPPPVFDRFFAPFYRQVRETFSARSKLLVVHGDGEMSGLLRKLPECGVQVVEAVTPKPMTSIDVAETRRMWQGKMTFFGGIACVMLTDAFSDDAFEQYLEDLFQSVAPGDRFILGFGDNVPTDALFSRVQKVAEFWAGRGVYPLGARRK